jgi:hypothetical protein
MKNMYKNILLVIVVSCSGLQMLAQEKVEKFSITGAARSMLFGDDLQLESEQQDTVTNRKLSSGHVLVDLGMAIRPNKNMEVLGTLRIRNDFGGFWGAGTTLDLRQLFVKGVVARKVRYQIGDINYKLSPYTLYNSDHETTFGSVHAFTSFSDIVEYDNFYDLENTWRQQGAAVDFGLEFKEFIEQIKFGLFTSRIRATDFAQNSERLFSSLNIGIVQSEFLELGLIYAETYDWYGTSRNPATFHNPVISGMASLKMERAKWLYKTDAEIGSSRQNYRRTDEDPDISGGFVDAKLSASNKKTGIKAIIGFKSVEADFRSPGAQTKRINFNTYPDAYQRVTNDQVLRVFTMYDLLRESDLYNRQLSTTLMAFDPRYDNITPYGDATPNRSGYSLGIMSDSEDKFYRVAFNYANLSELRGQGTEELRKFSRLQAEGTIFGNKLLKNYSKRLELVGAFRNDHTSRAELEGVPNVDLTTVILNLGLRVETVKDLDLIAGIQNMSYQGSDFLAARNTFDEVVYFDEYVIDGSEIMTGLGIRYNFSATDFVSVQWNNFKSTNTEDIVPDYDINQLAILYTMKF